MAERKGGPRPGDVEDVAGHPFVGPAGKLLDRALEQAGIDRRRVYVTNATIHPSSILRAPDEASRRDAMQGFVADLRSVAARLAAAETEQP